MCISHVHRVVFSLLVALHPLGYKRILSRLKNKVCVQWRERETPHCCCAVCPDDLRVWQGGAGGSSCHSSHTEKQKNPHVFIRYTNIRPGGRQLASPCLSVLSAWHCCTAAGWLASFIRLSVNDKVRWGKGEGRAHLMCLSGTQELINKMVSLKRCTFFLLSCACFIFLSTGMKMNSHSERQWKMKLIPFTKWLMMLI